MLEAVTIVFVAVATIGLAGALAALAENIREDTRHQRVLNDREEAKNGDS